MSADDLDGRAAAAPARDTIDRVGAPDLLVSDAERRRVADDLREHYEAGRLTLEEFQGRLDETHAAGVNRELLNAPILNPANDDGASRGAVGDRARVEVPTDINGMQEADRDQAIAWRRSTRAAFGRALAGGLTVQGFVIDDCAQRGYYLLARART